MKIGQLAAATGVSRDTLRFYEQRGLIRSRRSDNGYRSYDPAAAQLVAYIRTAQRLGFSLAEIGGSLPQLWDAPQPDAAVAALLLDKVAMVEARIGELTALRTELLERAAQICPLGTSSAPSPRDRAHISDHA